MKNYCISREPTPNLYGYFALRCKDGESLNVCNSKEDNHNIFNNIPKNKYITDINLPKSVLAPGEYYPYLSFADGKSLIDSFLEGIIF